MKKFFKNWTLFESLLLVFSIVAVLTVGICFKSDVLTIVTSIVGIICALLLAKGLVLGQFFGLAIVVLYSIVSYLNGFYGEMIIYIAIMFPMYIWGIVEWIRNRNNDTTKTVEVNEIRWKEWVCLSVCAAGAFVGFYFMLKALNTSQLIVSTLSVVDNIFAVYLLARRSKYGFVSYIVNDLILIVLWGASVVCGNWAMLAMALNPVVNLVNDIYGVVNWSRMQKQQKLAKEREV